MADQSKDVGPKAGTSTSYTRIDLTPKRLAIAGGILIAAFLLGYVPSCVGARNAEGRSAQLESKLRLADLQSKLGMASYEANRNNFASAAEMSTAFFNGLHDVIGKTEDAMLSKKFGEMLASRDEITAKLAAADPAVKERLAQMYAEFFHLTSTQQNRESS